MTKLKLRTFFLAGVLIKRERGYGMITSREQLHNIIDAVDSKELNLLYHLLIKFMPEDDPMADEIEAIHRGREEIKRGETVSHDDIDWD